MRTKNHADFRSFYFLNATQFLGALNDNLYKLLVIFFWIDIKGAEEANTILSLAGGVFVLPFLLFSSAGGVLADKFSKKTIIFFTKVLELLVMFFALIAVLIQSEFMTYFLLFMMGAQSAIFGPSKYGIIPELVEPEKVSKVNGLLTSFTYLAVILGTFLASFITDISHRNFELVALICVMVSVLGFFSSIFIRKTEARRSKKKINPFFLYEIYQSLSLSWKRSHLFPAILASSFFLFIGAYVQLNIIPFAIESLSLSEVGGGYLFLLTALGIAFGAWAAGKLSKNKIELGLACSAGYFIFIIFFILSFFSHTLTTVSIMLVLLGIFGGMFVIPMDSFIQVNSPDKRRGQIIAASNFLSFIGVLLAAFCLYLFNEKLGFTPAGSFGIIGGITLVFSITISGRLSEFFLPFISQKLLSLRYKVLAKEGVPKPGSILIYRSNSWVYNFLIFSLCHPICTLFLARAIKCFPYFNGLISCLYRVRPSHGIRASYERVFKRAKKLLNKNEYMLIIFKKEAPLDQILLAYNKVFGNLNIPVAFITMEKVKLPFSFSSPLKRRIIYFRFSTPK